jgi:prepilin-type N-terminal cleavage/methylation domain-containing protein
VGSNRSFALLRPRGADSSSRRRRFLRASRHLRRAGTRSDERGFGLVEVVIALSILATMITYISSSLVTSSSADGQAQASLLAATIASQTLQEAENLGYATVSEGIDCSGTTVSTCNPGTDPNSKLTASGGCFWYGPASDGYLVPSINETASVAPVIPYSSTVTKNGVTFTVVTYPMINTNSSGGYPSVTCAGQLAGTEPDVPITLLAVVSWSSDGSTHSVSSQTILYASPAAVPSAGSCPASQVKQGGHVESLLASPSPTPSVTAGANASIYLLDEQPTPYTPNFCVTDSGGNTQEISLSYTPTYYGSSSSYPFQSVSAVNSWGGSGPNAADAPTPGTVCGTTYSSSGPPASNCNLEELINFMVPAVNPNDGLDVNSFTITVWDHEGDMDTYTWNVTSSSVAPSITSGSSTTFTVGTAGSFQATASGAPAPTFSDTAFSGCTPSTLPSGVTFNSSGLLSGTPAAGTAGSYTLCIQASNGVGSAATQTFTLTVSATPPLSFAGLYWASATQSGGSLSCSGEGTATVTCSAAPLGGTGSFSAEVELVNGSGTAVTNSSGSAITVSASETTVSSPGGSVSPSSLSIANGSSATSSSFTLTGQGAGWKGTMTCTVTYGANTYTISVTGN